MTTKKKDPMQVEQAVAPDEALDGKRPAQPPTPDLNQA